MVQQKCVLCAETGHFPDGTSEMCTVHRNRTLSRRYSRNVYCAQKHNTFQTAHQKCVLCTEAGHFPDGTSEMCTVHRSRTLSRRHIINVYWAQKQNTLETVVRMYTVHRNRTLSRRSSRNVYCAQKQNTLQTVHQKCVLCTETEHFPDGTHKAVYTDPKNH